MAREVRILLLRDYLFVRDENDKNRLVNSSDLSYSAMAFLYKKSMNESIQKDLYYIYKSRVNQFIISFGFLIFYPIINVFKIVFYCLFLIVLFFSKIIGIVFPSLHDSFMSKTKDIYRGSVKEIFARCLFLFIGIFLHPFLACLNIITFGGFDVINQKQGDFERKHENNLDVLSVGYKWPRRCIYLCQQPMCFFLDEELQHIPEELNDIPDWREKLGIKEDDRVFFVPAHYQKNGQPYLLRKSYLRIKECRQYHINLDVFSSKDEVPLSTFKKILLRCSLRRGI